MCVLVGELINSEEGGGGEEDLIIAVEAVAKLGVNLDGIVVVLVGGVGFGARDVHGGSATWLARQFQLCVLELFRVIAAPPRR